VNSVCGLRFAVLGLRVCEFASLRFASLRFVCVCLAFSCSSCVVCRLRRVCFAFSFRPEECVVCV